MNKKTIFVLCSAAAGLLLTGCGAHSNTRKLQKMAEQYVSEKYGFKAKAGNVKNDSISWLEPKSNKSKAGIVEMTYKGKTFGVHAYTGSSVDDCSDNYMEDEWCSRIVSGFADNIRCDDMVTNITYGIGFAQHMVGKDIMTYDDLIKKYGPFNVYVNTYGLEPDSISAINISDIPEIGELYIYDWKDRSAIHKETLVTDKPTYERTELCSFAYFDKNKQLFEKYASEKKEMMNISYIDNGSFSVSECAVSPESPNIGVSEWYDLRNEGTEDMDVYISVSGAELDGTKEYHYEFTENGALQSPQYLMNNKDESGERRYFIHRVIPGGETVSLRITEYLKN